MLCPISIKDFDFITELLSENNIIQELFLCSNFSKKKYNVRNIVSSLISATDYFSFFLYIITDEHKQQRQGIICATIKGNMAEIGCVLSQKLRGKGIGYFSNQLIFQRVSSSCPNVTTFLAETANDNSSAIKTLLSLGFQQDFLINGSHASKSNRLYFRKFISSN